MILTSGDHHWRPIQACLLEDLPPPRTVLIPSGRYASFWNAVLYLSIFSKCFNCPPLRWKIQMKRHEIVTIMDLERKIEEAPLNEARAVEGHERLGSYLKGQNTLGPSIDRWLWINRILCRVQVMINLPPHNSFTKSGRSVQGNSRGWKKALPEDMSWQIS